MYALQLSETHFIFQGWQYSAIMFILLNAVALMFISYAYLRMINEIRASGVACRSTRQNQERDKVAQRFGIIVLTDCLCWVPVILVKLIALSGKWETFISVRLFISLNFLIIQNYSCIVIFHCEVEFIIIQTISCTT